jgi:manganese/zinc/iron transport system permease protein
MITEMFNLLSSWGEYDSWIVLTAALCAMSCALPGTFLVLRRQSMMGDALSHTVLFGIVIAYLVGEQIFSHSAISGSLEETTARNSFDLLNSLLLSAGAIIVGILSALLSEWLNNIGKVERSASLGIVFTTFFAAGLLLLRMVADHVDLDPACVLYGSLELVVLDTIGTTDIPWAVIVNGLMLLLNILLLMVFFKELRISTFDPELATSIGINARLINYCLMAVTAASLVAAFKSVGSILVVAMFITPPVIGLLLSDRLVRVLIISVISGAISAISGHAMAITLPPVIFSRLGYTGVSSASTAGMIAVSSGVILVFTILFSPRYGVIARYLSQHFLRLKITAEDLMGFLYRTEEAQNKTGVILTQKEFVGKISVGWIKFHSSVRWLEKQLLFKKSDDGWSLTEKGRTQAKDLVRSHRLWESYMARHFLLPEDHLHPTAEAVEHYIDSSIRGELVKELDQPKEDPHGREIPSE